MASFLELGSMILVSSHLNLKAGAITTKFEKNSPFSVESAQHNVKISVNHNDVTKSARWSLF